MSSSETVDRSEGTTAAELYHVIGCYWRRGSIILRGEQTVLCNTSVRNLQCCREEAVTVCVNDFSPKGSWRPLYKRSGDLQRCIVHGMV